MPLLHLIHNLYSATWSNVWAPSVWTLLGLAWHHVSIKQLHQDHHDELMGRVK